MFRRLLKFFIKGHPPRQLRMTYRFDATEYETASLPSGYRLGQFVEGAENEWIALLKACGFSMFSGRDAVANLKQEVLHTLLPAGGVFVYAGNALVACAAACARKEFSPNAVVMYVGVLPAHRRKGLGTAVLKGVLSTTQRAGFPGLTLLTDETRIPAISAYLRLGFRPDSVEKDMQLCWERILRQMGMESTSNPSLHGN